MGSVRPTKPTASKKRRSKPNNPVPTPCRISKVTCKNSATSLEAAVKRKLKDVKKKAKAEKKAQREAAARRRAGWSPMILKQLEVSRKLVPRYLFRGFHSGSGGGASGLNSIHAIASHFHLEGREKTSIFQYTRQEFRKLADLHLCTERVSTPFTSWAASPHVPYDFARGHQIAILDMFKLPQVEAYHVTELCKVGLAHGNYDHEYLLLGDIDVEAFAVMCVADLLKLIPGASVLPRFKFGYDSWELQVRGLQFISSLHDLVERVQGIVMTVQPAGPDFVLPSAIAVLTYSGLNFSIPKSTDVATGLAQKQKAGAHVTGYFPDSLQIDENMINQVLEGLGDTPIPQEYCLDPNILLDRVYTEDYEDVAQMIYLLRKLTDAKHGKRARHRPIYQRPS